MSLSTSCATVKVFDPPALRPWNTTDIGALADEMDRAKKRGDSRLMLRAIVEYHELREILRATR